MSALRKMRETKQYLSNKVTMLQMENLQLSSDLDKIRKELQEVKSKSMKRFQHNIRLTNSLRAVFQYTNLAGPEQISEEAGKLIRSITGSAL